MELIEKARNGDRRAIARLISMIENESRDSIKILKELYYHTGNAYIVGITGPPGSGKSTLTDKLVKELRKKNKRVAVLAVDPTSPYTGGAVLGDRVRMNDLTLDEDVFIRSMGTRGKLGGLSKKTSSAIKVFDACKYDYILIETVGVGQSEVDIVKTADSTIVVSVPGLGDNIQAIKAGVLEIGDIFVVNKSDRDDARRVAIELEIMLDMNPNKSGWKPPIQMTVATKNHGVSELVEVIENHLSYLDKVDLLDKKKYDRLEAEIKDLVIKETSEHVTNSLEALSFSNEIQRMLKKETDPYSLIEEVVAKTLK